MNYIRAILIVMDKFVEAQTFVAIAENGSIAAAARVLRRPASRVSRILSDLEARLGVSLAHRTTRSLRLTEAGVQYRAHCETALRSLDEAEQIATQKHHQLTGRLHILGVNVFSQPVIIRALRGFAQKHPGILLNLQQTDDVADIVSSGADLALRIGKIPSKRLICDQIAPSARLICASPDYIARNGRPQTLEDLADHACLVMAPGIGNRWEVEIGGKLQEIAPLPSFVANRADTLRLAALEGWGIAQLSDILIGPDLAAGRLVSLFPRRRFAISNHLCAIYPRQPHIPAKTERLIDHLKTELS